MKLEGEYLFNGPREEVWKLVRDPDVLATALPGTQSLNKISDTEFEGVMHLKIGPWRGTLRGLVYRRKSPWLHADGGRQGRAGFRQAPACS
jgi:carbon monoxide dehydrogenase subunit G